MPLPATLPTVTLTAGNYLKQVAPFDGVVTGTMTVTPSRNRVVMATGELLTDVPKSVAPVGGVFTAEVVASDAPGLSVDCLYNITFSVKVDGVAVDIAPIQNAYIKAVWGAVDLDLGLPSDSDTPPDTTPPVGGTDPDTIPPTDPGPGSGAEGATLAVAITDVDLDASGLATITWEVGGASSGVGAQTVGRSGVDTTGAGAWSGAVPAEARTATFDKLVPGAVYTFTVTVTAGSITRSTSTTVTLSPVEPTVPTQTLSHSTASTFAWADVTFPNPVGSTDVTGELVVSGLLDTSKNASLNLRGGAVRIIVRNNAWLVEAAGYTTVSQPFISGTSGTFKVVTLGTLITAYWNGTLISSVTVPLLGTNTTDTVGLGIWQNVASTVTISATVWETGATPTDPVDPPVEPGEGGTWYSGAASPYAANGTFGSWRGEAITVGGTWCNGNTYMLTLDTIQPGAEWGAWTGRLDIAVGAIEYALGETWAAAATGAYDARWIQSAKNINSSWTARGKAAGNLYVRFAHEMNGNWFPWRVPEGQEANFITAWRRWANIMRTYAPGVKLVWSVNKNRSAGYAKSINIWPGASYVDVYSVDSYNVWPWENTPDGINAEYFNKMDGSDPVGVDMHRQKAASYGVPFALSEWSNGSPQFANDGGGGGESTLFMDMINQWMRIHAGTGAGQLLYDVLFNLWPRYALYGSEATQPVTAARYALLVWGR
jgi:Glycosyl hydrolase family 26